MSKLPRGWEEENAGSLCDVISGGTPSTKIDKYWNGEIGWITPKDLSDYKDMYIERGERNISNLGLNKSSAKILPIGTVLFTSRAPIGYVAISKKELSTNQGFKNFVCKKSIIPEYLYYYLMKNVDKIKHLASGAVFPEISATNAKKIIVQYPKNPKSQKLIVKILDHAHKIIKEREEAIKLCEKLVEAAFYEMFGDPVRNEKKLKLEPLSKNIELNYGKALKKDDRVASGNFPVYGSNGIVGFHDNYVVEDQTIIVGRKGSCGDLHLTEKSCYPIDTTFFVTLKEKFIWEFLYMAMSQIPKEQYIRTAGVPGINRNDYLNAKIIVVSEEEQLKFKQIFDSNKKMIKSLQEALELEKQQFQALLQAAFEGRLTAHLDGEDE